MAFPRNLVGGQAGCSADGAMAGANPLTQFLDSVSTDPLRAQQMGGKLCPAGPGSAMDGMGHANPMEAAWRQPGMGPLMEAELRGQMEQMAQQRGGFFELGPVGAVPGTMEAAWANSQHRPQMMQQPPPGWAQEFHSRPMMEQAAASSSEPQMHRMMPMLGPMGSAMPALAPAMMSHASGPSTVQQVPQQAASLQESTRNADGNDLSQAAEMVQMLRSSGNPKYMNSEFVSFMDKVSKGELKFEDNKVVDVNGREVDWDDLYGQETAQSAVSAEQLGGELADFLSQPGREAFSEEIDFAAQEQEMNRLFEEWSNEMDGGYGMREGMESAWQKATEVQFAEDNPFRDEANALLRAQQLILEGRDHEAMLCLEVEVQRNPQSSEGWRLLGQLNAEQDQDDQAIKCLKKGYEADPYNLNSLMALGVSQTNEMESRGALANLRTWLANHEEYAQIVEDFAVDSAANLEADARATMELFDRAARINPKDADVYTAAGVVGNLVRDYPAATRALAQSVRLRPADHGAWNKLGATLANSGRCQEAITAYHQALSLKPNYTRAWSNLAIAHANLQQNVDACRFYLSALALNPACTHTWDFLRTVSYSLKGDRQELVEGILERNLQKCSRAIEGVVDPSNLPPRRSTLAEPVDDVLSSMGVI